jgi:hypothetical protein
MCSVQSAALSRRPKNSLIYLHNKNGKSWLPWRRPGDKRSELQVLDCPKAKQSSAIAPTRSVRWNQISALKREQLYRRNSKIQFAGGGVWACHVWRLAFPAFVTPKGYETRHADNADNAKLQTPNAERSVNVDLDTTVRSIPVSCFALSGNLKLRPRDKHP